jgi:hypothetical protein
MEARIAITDNEREKEHMLRILCELKMPVDIEQDAKDYYKDKDIVQKQLQNFSIFKKELL